MSNIPNQERNGNNIQQEGPPYMPKDKSDKVEARYIEPYVRIETGNRESKGNMNIRSGLFKLYFL